MLSSEDLLSFFSDRYSEVREYLEFIENIDSSVQSGNPTIGANPGYRIKPDQQKILYSCVYLQLYNLVEATVTKCIDYVIDAAIENRKHPTDLNEKLRKMWIKYVAKTHTDAAPETRLVNAILMCQTITSTDPISDFKIAKGGGGNWCDVEIRQIAKDIGLTLSINRTIYQKIKVPIRNDWGALKLVMSLRNELAHGSNTFVSCGENNTARSMRDLSELVASYLQEVINNFIRFVEEGLYLQQQANQV